MKRLFFDLEANGLLEAQDDKPAATRIHCVAGADIDTGETFDFGPEDLPRAYEVLEQADMAVAHNGLRYDFRLLKKLVGLNIPFEKQRDTLVIARTKRPNIKETDKKLNASRLKDGKPGMGQNFGKHTIEAWGFRLGVEKVGADITDWSVWTPYMHERCISDIAVIQRLWHYLKPDSYSQAALDLEHRIARVVDRISDDGWPFDEKAAGELHAHLLDERHIVEKKLKAEFGGWWQDNGVFVPKRPDAKRGYWGSGSVKTKDFKGYPVTKIEWVEFNPNSRPHIAKCLKALGWQPTEFTDGGAPKLDEEIIEGIAAQYPEAEGLTRYLLIDKRLSQLADGDQAWLKQVNKGRIHAQYNPMGAVTSRMAHFRPNIAQVPANASPYGPECRGLFTVPQGWEMVGADMSGLETRCLAHYAAKHDGGEYGKVVLEGDLHWNNVLAMGLLEGLRDKHNVLHTIGREQGAKRFFYAWMYGAGDEKAGRIILDACRAMLKADPVAGAAVYESFFGTDMAPGSKLLKRVGKRVKGEFLEKTPVLKVLKGEIASYVEQHGFLPGLDMRRLPVRSEHAALNTLLQSCGAILCKRWTVDACDALTAEGFKWGWNGDLVLLGNIHDENQFATRVGLGQRVGELAVKAAREAGAPYKFRIPLDGEFKVGRSWAETH